MATVDIHYLQAALRCATRKGLNTDSLLAQIGLSRKQATLAGTRVHADPMAQLVRLIWAGLDDEFMGCTQHRCKPGVFALMTRHALHYDRLQPLLEQGIQLYNLMTDDLQMTLTVGCDVAELSVRFARPELDPDHFYQEFWLVIWHRFASWAIGRRIPLHGVGFSYPRPVNADELYDLFPCPHHFDQPALRLEFSSSLLALPTVRTQRDLSRFLRHSPADMMTIPADEQSYSAQIRSWLLHPQDPKSNKEHHAGRDNPLICPSFEALAERFNISSQTLRRKLRAEGRSYPNIKDEIRRDLAIEKLFSQKLSITETARQLGFSEARSFTRAFKHWTGLSPSAYLRQRR